MVLLHGLTFDRTMWRPTRSAAKSTGDDELSPSIYPGTGRPPIRTRTISAASPQPCITPSRKRHSKHRSSSDIHWAVSSPPRTRSVPDVRRRERGPTAVRRSVRGACPRSRKVSADLTSPTPGRCSRPAVHTELLPPVAQQIVRTTGHPRQEVVLGYWNEVMDGPARVAHHHDRRRPCACAGNTRALRRCRRERTTGAIPAVARGAAPRRAVRDLAGQQSFPASGPSGRVRQGSRRNRTLVKSASRTR